MAPTTTWAPGYWARVSIGVLCQAEGAQPCILNQSPFFVQRFLSEELKEKHWAIGMEELTT